jgi:cytochrome c-type biogenesis protein CcmH
MRIPSYIAALLGLLLSWQVLAIDRNVAEFPEPQQELRYRHLIEELRCVVCQNQSLADSNASLAQDLRNEVRNMILAGKSDQEITGFLVERYGDFVLYNPPLNLNTLLLWLGPALLVAFGIAAMLYFVRRQQAPAPEETSLSAAEQAKLQSLLDSAPPADTQDKIKVKDAP